MKAAKIRKKSKWGSIKNDVKKVWGKISESDLDDTGGDLEAVGNLIEKKYFDLPIKYRDKLTEIYKRRLKKEL